ncbi:hypothetical protein [Micromonospora arida]|uniref:hypothetical protein n=1 Tax=Micromonospora arida TaxID=2203715 RepID=UPI0033B0CD1D
MTDSQITKITKAARLISERYNVGIRAIVIDAHHKQSVPRIKPPQDLRDDLHGRSDEAA